MDEKPKIFLDVNVFVDISEKREGWNNSLEIVDGVRKAKYEGCISALTVPILYFRRIRVKPDKEARSDVWKMIKGFEIIELDNRILKNAIRDSKFKDYEDAIQYHSAKAMHCIIVTRNKKDFPKKKGILNPEEFLEKLKV